MKRVIYTIATLMLLYSCGNETEEIKNPATGLLEKKFEYYLDDNGQKVKDGEYTEWNSNGDIRLKTLYKDGKKEGISTFYQSKDSIYISYYKDGFREGECRYENSNGVVLGLYNYKSGKLNGATTYNYPNGKPYLKAHYDQDLPTGTWKYFNLAGKQTGTLTMNDHFVPNELIGKWWIVGEYLTFFEFKKDGYVGYCAPLNSYSNEPFEQMSGDIKMGRDLTLQFGSSSHGKSMNFDIISVDKKKIVLRGISNEIEVTLEKM
jgi:hypothetical protein